MIFIRASKYMGVREMKPNPYFSNLKQPILCLFSYWSSPTNHFEHTFNCFVLYLAIIVLDNSLFLVGSISILRDNYYFWQSGELAVKSHQYYITEVNSIFWVITIEQPLKEMREPQSNETKKVSDPKL